MRRSPWTTCLWPGLPQLWSHGSWLGLAVALGAAAAFNVLLLVSFGWSELIGHSYRNISWAAFAAVWVAAVVWSLRERRRQVGLGRAEEGQDAFADAIEHYLKGDYYQAERLLDGLLRRNARDLDARLMLATLMRRTGRREKAAEQLDVLERLEGAEKWQLEIERERQRLAEAAEQAATAA
jgi:hypothetical protein